MSIFNSSASVAALNKHHMERNKSNYFHRPYLIWIKVVRYYCQFAARISCILRAQSCLHHKNLIQKHQLHVTHWNGNSANLPAKPGRLFSIDRMKFHRITFRIHYIEPNPCSQIWNLSVEYFPPALSTLAFLQNNPLQVKNYTNVPPASGFISFFTIKAPLCCSPCAQETNISNLQIHLLLGHKHSIVKTTRRIFSSALSVYQIRQVKMVFCFLHYCIFLDFHN